MVVDEGMYIRTTGSSDIYARVVFVQAIKVDGRICPHITTHPEGQGFATRRLLEKYVSARPISHIEEYSEQETSDICKPEELSNIIGQ
ncbi:hypothetical protein Trydic_g18922 [Trypoxylus dichotomus]